MNELPLMRHVSWRLSAPSMLPESNTLSAAVKWAKREEAPRFVACPKVKRGIKNSAITVSTLGSEVFKFLNFAMWIILVLKGGLIRHWKHYTILEKSYIYPTYFPNAMFKLASSWSIRFSMLRISSSGYFFSALISSKAFRRTSINSNSAAR